jgi:hypothetical protein
MPLGPHEALPNSLHIGYGEARRLMGREPSEGPVVRFMAWAHGHAGSSLDVVHIRDWHDRKDSKQREHLRQFGEHCIAESAGARFVFECPEHPHVHLVNATTLNDFDETRLSELFDGWLASNSEAPLRVGVVGVWTEAKVTFLCYELRTRYPDLELGVCGALCASSSRAEHYHALEQLSRILGVRVFSSVGEFSGWLVSDRLELPLPGVDAHRPRLVFGEPPKSPLSSQDERLVRYLFRDCQRVDLEALDGGFSGNRVLGAMGTDREGHQQVPHVVKIGPQDAIGRERAHFERIEAVLGNSAPQIADFADFGQRGALKYRYAAMGGGFSTTFQKRFARGMSHEETERILCAVFEEQLGRLYAAARRERCNLLAHYGFASKWAGGVRERVTELSGSDDPALGTRIAYRVIGASRSLYNVAHFYEQRLDQLPKDERESTYFAYVHGDLNGANIIVDRQENVWIIDFFHTRRAHVLMDLIKLENDLLYIMTPVADEAALEEALLISDRLLDVSDLWAELPEDPPASGEAFARTWATLRILRRFYKQLVHSDRSPLQLLVGQLRYAVHTLSFDEPSLLQRRWALYAACRLAERIDGFYSHSDHLRVDWLPRELTAPGRLGLTLLPGRRDMSRDLSRDVDALEHAGATHVLCLLGDDELHAYGVPKALEVYRERQLEVLQLPIIDQGVCSVEEMKSVVAWVEGALAATSSVVVHCAGGLGRSGIAAAAYLVERGLTADEAIATVRRARSPRAVETEAQVSFVERYERAVR